MIYLQLFLAFLKIGTISFGGGYGMVAVLFDEILGRGWMTRDELTDMIAVSESTPGPIAVNMATFVGMRLAGIAGGSIATLGVVLPAFVIILLISTLLSNLMKYRGVQAFLAGIRPCVTGMILATAVIMGMDRLLGVQEAADMVSPDYLAAGVLGGLIVIHLLYRKFRNKKPDPIAMILVSAAIGIAINML